MLMKKEFTYVLAAFILAITLINSVPFFFKDTLSITRQEDLIINECYEDLGESGSTFIVLPLLLGHVTVIFLPGLIAGVLTYIIFKRREKKED
jgi:hypothetical protein